MRAPRAIRRAPGPWSPTLTLESSGPAVTYFFPKVRPSNLDVKCKESLERVLRPCNMKVITPILDHFKDWEKKEIVLLGKCAGVLDKGWAPVIMPKVMSDPVITNEKGRSRLMKATHVSADKAQVELLRNRCQSDQKDEGLEKRREHLRNYWKVPTVNAVSSYYRLGAKSILSESSAKLLTEHARKGLAEWQVQGPEENNVLTAQVMHALENIEEVLRSLPSYTDISLGKGDGGRARTEALFELSHGHPRSRPLQPSQSMPILMARPPPPEDWSSLTRPGGYTVHYNDTERFQREKNRTRSRSSKVMLG